MATAVDSANLILKLYELRREPAMREARNFMMGFDPRSVGDYMAGVAGTNGPHIRMVMSYWEMAASFVVSGAIDASLFEASSDEYIFMFGKVEPYLRELREAMGKPKLFWHLEQVGIQSMKDALKDALRAELDNLGL